MNADVLLPTDEHGDVIVDNGGIGRCNICAKPNTPVLHLDKTASGAEGNVCPDCFRGDDSILRTVSSGNSPSFTFTKNDDRIPERVREQTREQYWESQSPDFFLTTELNFDEVDWTALLDFGVVVKPPFGADVDVVQLRGKSPIAFQYENSIQFLGGNDHLVWTRIFEEKISEEATDEILGHEHPRSR